MMQNAPQGTFTINFVQQLDELARHFAHIISAVRQIGGSGGEGGQEEALFDVKPSAEAEYIETMWEQSPPATGRPSGCTPGYPL